MLLYSEAKGNCFSSEPRFGSLHSVSVSGDGVGEWCWWMGSGSVGVGPKKPTGMECEKLLAHCRRCKIDSCEIIWKEVTVAKM